MKDSMAPRLDEIHDEPGEGFKERGLLCPVMDKEQLKVRGITHFTAAKLAKAEDCIREGRIAGSRRATGSRHQLAVTDVGGFLEDHVAKVGERIREIRQRRVALNDMRRVDKKHLAVLEDVQDLLLL